MSKYIKRNDYSWRVRLVINQKTVVKSFSFKKYGGINKSLMAAISWRSKTLVSAGLLERLNYKKSPHFYPCHKAVCSPIVGVSLDERGRWTASYILKKIQHKRRFSIQRYGDCEAFLLACEVRYAHSGTLRVIRKASWPCRPEAPFV